VSPVFALDVSRTGIYFTGKWDRETKTTPLNLYRFSDGKTVELGRVDKPMRLQSSVSPDEKWLTWTQRELSVRDIMRVENFR
jgi:hypothetical protein